MKSILLICAVLLGICAPAPGATREGDITAEILAMERNAMQGWLAHNPDPALSMMDDSITYFHDPVTDRLNGLPAVRDFFERFRGRKLFDTYEIDSPTVQVHGDIAVLTYQLAIEVDTVKSRWNATEVFENKRGNWRVIHAHWSKVSPPPTT